MSNVQVRRSEFIREKLETSAFGVVEKPLTAWERIYNQSAARKAAILVVLAAIWEVYASVLDNPLLFPTFSATLEAFWNALATGGLLERVWTRSGCC